MQCHVLGVVLLPIVGALLVADVRRRGRGRRGGPAAVGLVGLAIVALTYVPLVVHELTRRLASRSRARLPGRRRRPADARAARGS